MSCYFIFCYVITQFIVTHITQFVIFETFFIREISKPDTCTMFPLFLPVKFKRNSIFISFCSLIATGTRYYVGLRSLNRSHRRQNERTHSSSLSVSLQNYIVPGVREIFLKVPAIQLPPLSRHSGSKIR